MPQNTNTAGLLRNIVTAILLTGLVAGTLDGIAAVVNYLDKGGKKPEIVFKYIASGVFGSKAFTGGDIMIIWGVFFHFLISYGLTVFYYWLYPRVKWIGRNWTNTIITGLFYGIFAWVVATRVIVPLSKIQQKPFVFTVQTMVSIAILMIFIGLPISLMARKHYLYKK
jgi:hypothetical protein